MKSYLWIGLGGVIGATLRFSVSELMYTNDLTFPWDTLTVNLIGSFILSLITFSTALKKMIPSECYPIVTTGILGSFTTFSAIMVESVDLMQENILLSMLYISVTIIGGLLSAGLAYTLSRRYSRKQVR